MKKRIFFIMVAFIIFSGNARPAGAVEAAAEKKEKASLADIISRPFDVILAPVKGGELVDIILKPVDPVTSPLFDLGKTAETPGRTREYLFNINRNVTVVTEKDMKAQVTGDIQQVLERAAGLQVNGYMNNPKDNSIVMRGFGENANQNYLVLIDGRRTNQVDLSGPDLSQIDIGSVDRIEISRGANSVLYGDNATGGVLNLITKKGKKGDHITYTQEYGSYRYWKQHFSVEGGHEFLDYFISCSWQDTDGYRANNGYEADDIFSSVTFKPRDNVNVRLSSGYHRDWYGQPGALYDGNMRTDGREGTRFPDSKAKTEDYFINADPSVTAGLGDHEIAFRAPVSYRSRRAESVDVGFNRYEAGHHVISWEFKPKCEAHSVLLDGGVDNKLVFGLDYFYALDRVDSGDVTFTKTQVDIKKETLGVYASDILLLDKKFIFSGGVRGEWAEYVFDQFQPAFSIDKSSQKEIALEAGAGFKYNERSQIYASYARSYRFPATDELFESAYEQFDWTTFTVRVFPSVLNTYLRHQVGNNYEAGIKDNSFEPVRLNACYYFIDNKNEIYYDPVSFRNDNYANTMHHGLELEARADIYEIFDAYFNYTYQRSTFEGGQFDGYTMPLAPGHKITGGVTARPVKGLSFDLCVNYVGPRVIASDPKFNSSPLESYVTMDLAASYEIKYFRIFGAIRNLAGEKYYSNATRNFMGNTAFYPAPERSYEWGVSILF